MGRRRSGRRVCGERRLPWGRCEDEGAGVRSLLPPQRLLRAGCWPPEEVPEARGAAHPGGGGVGCGRGEGRAGGLAKRDEGSAGGRSEEAAPKGGGSRGSHPSEPDKPCGETGCPLVTVTQLTFGCSLLKANTREARVRRKERCFNQKSRQSGEEVDSRPEINSEDSAQP